MRYSLDFISFPMSGKLSMLVYLPEAQMKKRKVKLYVIIASHIGLP